MAGQAALALPSQVGTQLGWDFWPSPGHATGTIPAPQATVWPGSRQEWPHSEDPCGQGSATQLWLFLHVSKMNFVFSRTRAGSGATVSTEGSPEAKGDLGWGRPSPSWSGNGHVAGPVQLKSVQLRRRHAAAADSILLTMDFVCLATLSSCAGDRRTKGAAALFFLSSSALHERKAQGWCQQPAWSVQCQQRPHDQQQQTQ